MHFCLDKNSVEKINMRRMAFCIATLTNGYCIKVGRTELEFSRTVLKNGIRELYVR